MKSANMIPFLMFSFLLLSVEVSLVTSATLTRINDVTSPTRRTDETITEPGKEVETTVENETDFTGSVPKEGTAHLGSITSSNSTITPAPTEDTLPALTEVAPLSSTEDTLSASSEDTPLASTEDTLSASTEDTPPPTENTPPPTEDTPPASTEDTPPLTEDTPAVSTENISPASTEVAQPTEDTLPASTEDTSPPPTEDTPPVSTEDILPASTEVAQPTEDTPPASTEDTPPLTEDTPPVSTENISPASTEVAQPTEDTLPASTEDTSPPPTEDTPPVSTEDISPASTEVAQPTEDKSPPPTEDTPPVSTEDISPASTEDAPPSTTEDITTLSSTEVTTPTSTEVTTPTSTEVTTPTSTEVTTPTSTEDATSSVTFSTSTATTSVEPHSDDGVNAGLAIGIVLAILLVGVGIVLWRAYSSGRNLWPPKNLFSNGTPDSIRPQPVAVKKFPSHCSEMLEVPSKLSHEYQLLATLSVDIYATESFVAAQMPDNKYKNRYVNILPFDSTRVKLSPEGDEEFYSDYVNASYVKGYTNDIEYIATQGPKEDTCRDFWRMVYQEPIKVIVMVTQLEEQGKPKCYKYFPNLRENLEFEDIIVRCSTELHFPIYTSRTFILTKGERKRSITHLHFREWPDFGCPATPDLMLQFCQVMRQTIILAQPGITLIHCSAGVGRTGTLIAVDILMQHIKENKKIDIFGTVFKLRKHRMNMVQSETQYVYLYKCVKEALEDPSYLSSENSSTTSLEPIYENIECARLSSIPSKDMLDTVTDENECAF